MSVDTGNNGRVYVKCEWTEINSTDWWLWSFLESLQGAGEIGDGHEAVTAARRWIADQQAADDDAQRTPHPCHHARRDRNERQYTLVSNV